jgi:hypothetical protein
MKLNWKRYRLLIAGAVILITATLLFITFRSSSVNPDQVKGTIGGVYTPALGDDGTVRSLVVLPASGYPGLGVHFDKDPNGGREITCVQFDDDNAAKVGGRVRCIVAGNPVQVTNN